MMATAASATALSGLPANSAASKPIRWPFYAFDNGLRSPSVRTLEAKCKLLKDLGYVGLEYHIDHAEMPAMLEQLDRHGLKMNAIYYTPRVGKPLDPRLPEMIGRLKGRDTRIEMAIGCNNCKPSDTSRDQDGVDMLKRVSDMCADTGPSISIYPHTGCWTERVEDGVRMAKLVGRKNLGTNFNLVHWKWVKQTIPLERLLRQSLPHIFAVTINGHAGRRIVSLDQGDFDIQAFMALVHKVGYAGDVGLQCYSVEGDSRDHLKRSMQKWREVIKNLNEG